MSVKENLQQFLDYQPNFIPSDASYLKYIRLLKRSKKTEFIYLYVNKDGNIDQIEDKDTNKLGLKLTRATYKNNAFLEIPKQNVYKLVEFIMSKQDTYVIQGFLFYNDIDMTFWIKGNQKDIINRFND